MVIMLFLASSARRSQFFKVKYSTTSISVGVVVGMVVGGLETGIEKMMRYPLLARLVQELFCHTTIHFHFFLELRRTRNYSLSSSVGFFVCFLVFVFVQVENWTEL
jgi:hypothetical protein